MICCFISGIVDKNQGQLGIVDVGRNLMRPFNNPQLDVRTFRDKYSSHWGLTLNIIKSTCYLKGANKIMLLLQATQRVSGRTWNWALCLQGMHHAKKSYFKLLIQFFICCVINTPILVLKSLLDSNAKTDWIVQKLLKNIGGKPTLNTRLCTALQYKFVLFSEIKKGFFEQGLKRR